MPGLGERRKRLCRFTAQLDPEPEEHPYYVQVPRSDQERAPGWYMRRGGEVLYLGYSAGDAEWTLRDLLKREEAAAAPPAPPAPKRKPRKPRASAAPA